MRNNKMVATLFITILLMSMWAIVVSAKDSLPAGAGIVFYETDDDDLDSLSTGASGKMASKSGSSKDGTGSGADGFSQYSTSFYPNMGGNTNNQVIFDMEPGTVMILDENVPLSQLGQLPKTGGVATSSNGLVPMWLCLAGVICLVATVDTKSIGLGV